MTLQAHANKHAGTCLGLVRKVQKQINFCRLNEPASHTSSGIISAYFLSDGFTYAFFRCGKPPQTPCFLTPQTHWCIGIRVPAPVCRASCAMRRSSRGKPSHFCWYIITDPVYIYIHLYTGYTISIFNELVMVSAHEDDDTIFVHVPIF